ncbi:hypothetical protein [Microbulbifer sp. TYP-18]|uniref:hypothetical protein n=1 Tax=Microbulbifer sp. TYP-18 TaxID=3230024 RepID=UPI0034C620BB
MNNVDQGESLKMNREIIILIFLLNLFIASDSFSQELQGPPEYSTLDRNNVNLVTGYRTIQREDLLIGAGDSALRHTVDSYTNYFRDFRDNFIGTIEQGYSESRGSFAVASFNGLSTRFSRSSDGTFLDTTFTGASLIKLDDENYIYTHGDGTLVEYKVGIGSSHGYVIGSEYRYNELAYATKATYPSGLVITVHRKSKVLDNKIYYRVQSVTNNLGMQLKYRYATNTPTNTGFLENLPWSQPVEIIGINNSVEYCDPVADSCSLSKEWPSVKYSWPVGKIDDGEKFTITFPNGSKAIYTHGLYCSGVQSCNPDVMQPRISQIKEASSSGVATQSYDYSHTYRCTNAGVAWDCTTIRPNVVASASRGNEEWRYTYEIPPYSYVTVKNYSSGPDGYRAVWILPDGKPSKVEDSVQDAVFELSFGNRVTKVTYDDAFNGHAFGRSIEFDYDGIGNIIERREIPKEGSGNTTQTSTAGFSNNCGSSNVKAQHGAAWVKDARGYQTDFTYHCASGKLATVTQPAGSDGARPQIRYSYEQKYAWYKNSSGAYVKASSPIWLLVQESSCTDGAASGAGCADASKEVIKEYEYGPDSGPNNLWLRGESVTAGGKTQRTCFQYDDYGNRVAETLPNANLSSCQ